jgi:hypothetical protein
LACQAVFCIKDKGDVHIKASTNGLAGCSKSGTQKFSSAGKVAPLYIGAYSSPRKVHPAAFELFLMTARLLHFQLQFEALRKRDSSASLATEKRVFNDSALFRFCDVPWIGPANTAQSGRRIPGSGLGDSSRFSIVAVMMRGAMVGGALMMFGREGHLGAAAAVLNDSLETIDSI